VLAPSIGPALGGWITDNYSWHWIFFINIPVGILAFVLTNRLVEDPPFARSDRKNLFKLDYVGLSLLIVAMGSLQIALDKGEENGWFGSNFIRGFAFAFVISFAGLMIWEWYKKDPLIDIRLFRFKNFAVCCFLMMLTGGFLNATTVLQPQFLQQTIGYTATNAGFSLTAGGIALLITVPIAGQLVGRFPARNLIILGFSLFIVGYYFSATRLSLGMSFNNASILRVLQVVAIPFVFISVTTAAYFGIPSEKNNQVSGLINFARNIGGSILISITGAIVTESGLWHQNQMRKYLTPTDPYFHNRVNALKDFFTTSAGKANAEALAQGTIYNQLNQQATALGYVDVFWILCAAAIVMIPLSFLLDKNNPQDQKGKVMME
jgi:DHA2 family multidrug resistance protein